MNRQIRPIAILAAVLLAGCASSPFDKHGVEIIELSPAQALDRPERTGSTVVWGGRVVGIVNDEAHTELEVLALPLAMGDRPRRDADGGARFVIRHPGFLDPVTWAPGRYVTALGTFTGFEMRSVGAFPLRHPVLESQQLELWPVDTASERANAHFGLGVRF